MSTIDIPKCFVTLPTHKSNKRETSPPMMKDFTNVVYHTYEPTFEDDSYEVAQEDTFTDD